MPEHDKITAHKEKHPGELDAIGSFLEWVVEDPDCPYAIVDTAYRENAYDIEAIIADYIGVDRVAFHAEKDALLEHVRHENDVADAVALRKELG
jgi:hypothetical protein